MSLAHGSQLTCKGSIPTWFCVYVVRFRVCVCLSAGSRVRLWCLSCLVVSHVVSGWSQRPSPLPSAVSACSAPRCHTYCVCCILHIVCAACCQCSAWYCHCQCVSPLPPPPHRVLCPSVVFRRRFYLFKAIYRLFGGPSNTRNPLGPMPTSPKSLGASSWMAD